MMKQQTKSKKRLAWKFCFKRYVCVIPLLVNGFLCWSVVFFVGQWFNFRHFSVVFDLKIASRSIDPPRNHPIIYSCRDSLYNP